jgi:hypothetical protein
MQAAAVTQMCCRGQQRREERAGGRRSRARARHPGPILVRQPQHADPPDANRSVAYSSPGPERAAAQQPG